MRPSEEASFGKSTGFYRYLDWQLDKRAGLSQLSDFLSVQVQLIFTAGMVWLFTSHQPTREFAFQNMWLLIVAIIVMFVTIIMISCCEGVRRATPHNFIVLGLFTLAEGFVVAFGTMRFEAEIVRSPPSLISSDL